MAMNSIEKAVEAAGGVQVVADRFGIRRQAIEKWISHKRLPPKRVLDLEAASGVSRHELRPDLYPRDSAA